jgi:hypothetical protein
MGDGVNAPAGIAQQLGIGREVVEKLNLEHLVILKH